jgi:succinyl-diaminopimelate desuccinylase
MGRNAIHEAAEVLCILRDYVPAELKVDGLVYREGLNAVGISGGVAGNVIPDEAVVSVNYRFAPSRSGEEAIAHVREVFAGFEVEVTDLAEGARPGLDDPLAQQFVAAVGGVARPKYGWTDVARFSALGIPAVNYGPGDPQLAHADDERVAVDEILACERGLRAWLGTG